MPLQSCFRTAVLVVLSCSLVGCSGADPEAGRDASTHGHDHDHDHGHRPDSLHAAVAELTEMRDAIRDAILTGEPDDAHGPLHEVGELLEAIPDIAAETDLPEEEWTAVNKANEQLFDAFGAIDKAFHTKDGDKKSAYEGVADQLDEAIEVIRSKLSLTGEEPPAEEAGAAHDHELTDEPATSDEAKS